MSDERKSSGQQIHMEINGVTYTVGLHFKDQGQTIQDKMKRLIVHDYLYGDDGARHAPEERERL